MSTRNPNVRADSSSVELLSALYDAETELVRLLQPAVIGASATTKLNHLKRVRRLVNHHLRQQGMRANEDDHRDRPE